MSQFSQAELVKSLEKKRREVITWLDSSIPSDFEKAFESGYKQCLDDILRGLKDG